MITLKELHESPLTIKAVLLWLILMPFWYINLYLFAPQIIQIEDPFLNIALCFCFSFLSIIPTFFAFVHMATEQNKEKEKKQNIMDVSVLAVAFLVFWNSFLTFLGFSWKLVFKEVFTLYGFLATYFIPVCIIFLTTLIHLIKKHKIQS